MEPDFSGYVTKYGVRCTDGRTIQKGAFKHQDTLKVPLVYQHQHNDISQVLGYTILSAREDGIWGDSYLNNSAKAQDARAAVQHGDLTNYSIWAKDLEERVGNGEALVHDGVIQETSLVLAGANAGASIYNVLSHGALEDDEFMIVGGEIEHADGEKPAEQTPTQPEPQQPAEPNAKPEDAPKDPADQPDPNDKTVADVLATLDEEQQTAVNAFIDDVVKEAVTEALTEEPQLTHSDSSQKGNKMSRNAFDRSKEGGNTATIERPSLKHDDVQAVLARAKGNSADGGTTGVPSLREFVRSQTGKELMHADDYGIQNVEVLFPDAQALMQRPTFVDRRQDWVKKFLAGTSHSPFSRVKTTYADITADEARARGYIKANQKVDEVFPVFRRTTGPAWIYKRQKLDRQDIIDITDFDVVAWMKVEMRGKLDEELARAALFGDGRDVLLGDGTPNPDKIQEPTGNEGNGIRSIFNDDDLYATRYSVPMPTNPVGADWNILLDTVTESGEFYLGSGNKTAFVSYRVATKLLTIRDDFGHRIYRNLGEVAGDMDVTSIVRVPTELMPDGCLAIVLDLADYNFGTDRGGEVTLFDDFDIDFNQYKYLLETYLSGALTLPYSAQIFMQVDAENETLVSDLTAPAVAANVITVPTQTGVVYTDASDGSVLTGGSTITLNDTTNKQTVIEAKPAAGYYFESDSDMKDNWTFRYKA